MLSELFSRDQDIWQAPAARNGYCRPAEMSNLCVHACS